ncbi:hypothetical protein CAS74_002855 [Pichia kudriavzevii]|nr:uncharacterized protein C5L36_0E03850 [Pichia kudriavzevii]AWU78327.1 hypothetical protein C5L36_0E03850 [Pichia kudriavzevii]OUT21874.1 hypothetical protein CAS74_002855 [Pichia kudriavzevii]
MSSSKPTDPNDPLYTPDTSKVDLSSLSPQELKLYKLYGKLPKTNDILRGKLKERKFFDSGDYAMSKAASHGERANIPDQVGVLNPLHNPEIENVARINRNSVVGSVSIGTNVSKKSKLEEDSTG